MRAQNLFLANVKEKYARELSLHTPRRRVTSAQNRPGDHVTQLIQQSEITWGDKIELEVRG
jgi:hypothetical protein